MPLSFDKDGLYLTALEAMMRLLAEKQWRTISLNAISQESGLPLSQLISAGLDKTNLLDRFSTEIDIRTLRQIEEENLLDGLQPKESLFEIMMVHFEVLLPYRQALARLYNHSFMDPFLTFGQVLRLERSLARLLDKAGIYRSNLKGLLNLQAFTILYFRVWSVWLSDTSEELEKTMAALNKGLERFFSLPTNS